MANVQVGCMLPNGLVIDHKGHKVKLNGKNSSRLIGSFGITEVEKEFFDGWMANNKSAKFVANGSIFAVDTPSKVEGAAKEREKQKTGMEGLDPDKPTKSVKKDDSKE